MRRLGLSALLTVLVILFVPASPGHAENSSAKNILVLYSGQTRDHESLDLMESTIRAHVHNQVNFSVSYLDYDQLDNQAYRESLAETLRRGYGAKLDLIITFSYQALQFTVEYRDKMLPGVPIVFGYVAATRLEGQRWQGVTGLTTPVGMRETIDLALRLHPDAKAVAVISESESYWWSVAHGELLRHRDRVREIDLIGPPSGEMIEQLTALPPNTVVLFQLAAQDSSHPAIGAYDVLAAAAQGFPTYSPWKELCLNHGGVGGAYPDGQTEARLTGEIAARVLSGERTENIPIVTDSNTQVLVDWRQLLRWNIPVSALPQGSVILYRQPTLWERYKKWIIAASVIILAQAFLIAGLLWQHARKRKAEAILRESEKRFQVMADTMPALVWMCDLRGKIIYLNDRRLAFTGSDPNTGYGDSWIAYVHPDDLSRLTSTFSRALQTHEAFSNEFRLRLTNGVYRWMLNVASPRINGDGSLAGFIGSAIDTTDQKLAQEALEKVSGQLIQAQEKERSRIARDLHDDICQRLALLSMELDLANGSLIDGSVKSLDLGGIQKRCVEIAKDTQSLSHQLHSSMLELLGIVAALRSLIDELSQRHKLRITFRERNVPDYLPPDTSLCLFRVAQEALHNALKYSGANHFTVEIFGKPNEIYLAVMDRGNGFELDGKMRGQGLGLISMQERVHLVHGTFSIESKPGGGTKVVATVPFPNLSNEVSAGARRNSVEM
jgi:PAS domain S-box